MARDSSIRAECIHVVSFLLALSGHNLQPPIRIRNGRRIALAQTISTDQKHKTTIDKAAQRQTNNTLHQEKN